MGDPIKGVPFDIWSVFFTVFGVIYAIIVGFILFDTPDSYNDLKYAMRDELNAIQDVRDLAIYLREQSEVTKQLLQRVNEYVDSVVNREWKNRIESASPAEGDTSPEIRKIMRTVDKIQVKDQNDELAVDHLIKKIGDLTSYRTKRWHNASDRLSPMLRLLVIFLSSILAIGFILLHTDSVWLHIFLVSAITFSISVTYQVVQELNRPFKGAWSLRKKPFIDLKDSPSETFSDI